MKETKCAAFIGHRDCVGMEEEIYTAIKNLIDLGVYEFLSGGMGNFDKVCESVVKDLGAKLVFVPYNIRQIKETDKLWYDRIICPFGNKKYSKYDIPNRNKWMIEKCDICFCYVYKDGGAKRTLDYALKKAKQIINIAHK